MSAIGLIKILFGSLLLPPGNGLLLLGLAGLFRRRRWALGVALLGGGLLLMQSMPLVSQSLMGALEQRAGKTPQANPGVQAIVVLGSGLLRVSEEFGGDTANERTLVRVRQGALLARRWKVPVLVTGGRPPNMEHSEAEIMAGILSHEFDVPVRWLEGNSADTADNARLSAAMLRASGVHRVALVTQAFHMPRALALFRAQGLDVVPAPTYFVSTGVREFDAFDLLPSASALHNSYYALHEWLGIAWAELANLR